MSDSSRYAPFRNTYFGHGPSVSASWHPPVVHTTVHTAARLPLHVQAPLPGRRTP